MNDVLIDRHPEVGSMQADVLAGLTAEPKQLPSKYFYDARGAELFEWICELPEYYPTRTELAILEAELPAIRLALGPGRWIVEPGSGSGLKTERLLAGLDAPAGYVPIDIARDQLLDYAARLRERFPAIAIHPACADFTRDMPLPPEARAPVIWFPGSTIGNFHPPAARDFLRRLHDHGGGGAELLLGVDLKKDPAVLNAAYNDAAGVTAEFNRNLIRRLARELGLPLDPADFEHEARWNAAIGAVQMFLISRRAQHLELAGRRITLASGEAICTEYSYKYSLEEIQALAADAGWRLAAAHCDPRRWFAVLHFQVDC